MGTAPGLMPFRRSSAPVVPRPEWPWLGVDKSEQRQLHPLRSVACSMGGGSVSENSPLVSMRSAPSRFSDADTLSLGVVMTVASFGQPARWRSETSLTYDSLMGRFVLQ